MVQSNLLRVGFLLHFWHLGSSPSEIFVRYDFKIEHVRLLSQFSFCFFDQKFTSPWTCNHSNPIPSPQTPGSVSQPSFLLLVYQLPLHSLPQCYYITMNILIFLKGNSFLPSCLKFPWLFCGNCGAISLRVDLSWLWDTHFLKGTEYHTQGNKQCVNNTVIIPPRTALLLNCNRPQGATTGTFPKQVVPSVHRLLRSS